MLRLLLAAMIFLCVLQTTAARTERIAVPAVRCSAPPTIDGVLDDPCWQGLQELTGFVISNTQKPADPQTFVRICYDSENIYISVSALNPNSSKLVAVEKRRNGGNLTKDDYVEVFIDSRHLHRSSSSFRVNSLGTQGESIESSSSSKIEWKGDWQAAAKVTNAGYDVEMAIPFSLLIFDKGQNTFGIWFGRRLAEQEVYTVWPDLGGVWDITLSADWEGVRPPWAPPKPVVMGYALASVGDGPASVTTGLDAKYRYSSNMTALLSVSPDLGTIEQDAESVDFSYQERRLSDHRPFFQDWSMPVNSMLFYSRRIADFDLGARLAGDIGTATYGLMNVRSSGDESDTALGYSQPIGERSKIEMSLVDHRLPGHVNSSAYYGGVLGWKQGRYTMSLEGGALTSATTGMPGGQSKSARFTANGSNGDLGMWLFASETDPDFSPEIGYSTGAGTRGASGAVYWSRSRDTGTLRSASVSLYISNFVWTEDPDVPFTRSVALSAGLGFSGGRGLNLSLARTAQDQYRDQIQVMSCYWNADKANEDGDLSLNWGRRADGDYLYLRLRQNCRIGPQLTLGLQGEYSEISEPSPEAFSATQFLASLSYDIDSENSIGGRLLIRDGKLNAYLAYRKQVRQGADIYVIIGDPNADEVRRLVTMKLVQLIR